jgi:uncharacterized protein YjbK
MITTIRTAMSTTNKRLLHCNHICLSVIPHFNSYPLDNYFSTKISNKDNNKKNKKYHRRRSAMIQSQEIEIKITLLSKEDYEKFESKMGEPCQIADQENIFFDGSQQEITRVKSVLRLRLFREGQRERCVMTHKASGKMEHGVNRAEETEEDIDCNLAREAIENPSVMLSWSSDLVQMVKNRYQVKDFVCLGGFKNLRKRYKWEGHVIELDKVTYPFGTNYEIELETYEPEVIKPKLIKLLDSLNVSYQDSKRSKFANFFAGSIAI